VDKAQFRISVRNMIEFLLRSGDIYIGMSSSGQMQQGTQIHRKLQAEAGEGYEAEVRLSLETEFDGFSILVEGIADGILKDGEKIVIDEIKSTSMPLELIDEEYSHLHWAQAKCYGWMFLCQIQKPSIIIQLTYCHTKTNEIMQLRKEFSYKELEEYYTDLVEEYGRWMQMTLNHKSKRDQSISRLSFPFPQYRKGQRKLAAETYLSIRDKKLLFAQAPTGIGKTISVLFPSIKAMGEGMGEKIFYLTAKTVTRQVAEETIALLAEGGLHFRYITLTAKDKICMLETPSCNPEDCPYARGHYTRVNTALMDILSNENLITRDVVLEYARKYNVCPFEYTLDIALWADCIICDYNHVFDPRAYLRRFFDFGGDYVLLVDEAHNLGERARDMFSADLSKQAFMKYRGEWKQQAPDLYKAFTGVNKWFIELRKSYEKSYDDRTMDLPADFLDLLRIFHQELETYLLMNYKNAPQDLMDLFFDCRAFLSAAALFDLGYLVHVIRQGSDVRIKLLCADPSQRLRKTYEKNRAAVFYSGTLQPLAFYKDILGAEAEDRSVCLPSPFPAENFCLLIAGNISTRYKDRADSFDAVAQYIKAAVDHKIGNYLVFFPSFQYMDQVCEIYQDNWPEDRIMVQQREMDDNSREDFLSAFIEGPAETMIAFAVMGGIFAEGIDLPGSRLSGAVIVGVGLPQLSAERDLISSYYKERNGRGFEYAYQLPGLNRVMQAAGRVIRTETDRGFVLLLDDRFLHKRYRDQYPAEWQHYCKAGTPVKVSEIISQFW
jgi:DNA excision repair protein ERCC-2